MVLFASYFRLGVPTVCFARGVASCPAESGVRQAEAYFRSLSVSLAACWEADVEALLAWGQPHLQIAPCWRGWSFPDQGASVGWIRELAGIDSLALNHSPPTTRPRSNCNQPKISVTLLANSNT